MPKVRAGNQGIQSIPEDNPACKLSVRFLIYNDIVAVSKFRVALDSALPQQRSQYDLDLLNNSGEKQYSVAERIR